MWKRQEIEPHASTRESWLPFDQSLGEHAMAAHPAAKAINTQEITDKARRGLLQLLEGVSVELCFRDFHLLRTGTREEESGN